EDGLASCTFILGTEEGTQTVTASITGDSEDFTATAMTPECPQEALSPACLWPPGRIYIVTTSSAILGTGGGSVILEFNPVTGVHSLVYQTNAELQDIAFSPRGEMFVADEYGIYIVDRDPAGLIAWVSFSGTKDVEIEPNYGSVLTMIDEGSEVLSGVYCPVSSLSSEVMVDAVRRDCLAVDPLSRDVWYVTGNYFPFTLTRREWDGRSDFGPVVDSRPILLESAAPNGMCADSTGTVYVLLDGNAVNRRIGRMSPDGTWTDNLYNLYALSAVGRYGDIVWSGGNLYMVDTRNNRLVVISDEGTFVAQYTDEDFSASLAQDEKYGIAVSPGPGCP
ncbi:MAG TPA: hypothetical protein VLA34_14960, partial [Candidatus Krumholzibacterium sp.]|nr:hypothetical protein [Candidatus Krumholzibacterium sp.]